MMYDQLDAFARNTDPITSHLAARAVKVNERERDVLRLLIEMGGTGTMAEIVAADGGNRYGALTPRFRPLSRKGFIVQDGEKVNETGRRAIVWRITDAGRGELDNE